MLKRKCCDLCGFSEERIFALFSDIRVCPICGYEFDDEALLHPDDFIEEELFDGIIKRKISLNYRRFDLLVRSKNRGVFKDFFCGPNYLKSYKLWRKMYPELASQFNMSEFKENPEFYIKLISIENEKLDNT